ncbi:MAG: DUF2834 domain-containing protein [Brachymonas sp.]|nr:DUF2834 domain-containing protein [Brachymonas sp.]
MKTIYFLLCIAGTVLPLSQFVPWLAAHGLNAPLMVQQIAASPLSAFAWLDVLVSALAVIAFVLYEGRRLRMPRAWLALLGLCVGVSLALPLFLWMRERHEQRRPHGAV